MQERRLIPVKLDSYKPLREIVFETLRDAIIKQVLKPGERMMEIQLAEELGVSRTPVREAIRKLELEGFVVMIPRKGAYVADISLRDITEVFEIRGALEALAAGLACERITEEELEELERHLVIEAEYTEKQLLENLIDIDTEFHDILYGASRNSRLVGFLNNIREQILRFRKTSFTNPGRVTKALEEHKKLVEAIAARDVTLAQQLALEHVENVENGLIDFLKQRGELGIKAKE